MSHAVIQCVSRTVHIHVLKAQPSVCTVSCPVDGGRCQQSRFAVGPVSSAYSNFAPFMAQSTYSLDSMAICMVPCHAMQCTESAVALHVPPRPQRSPPWPRLPSPPFKHPARGTVCCPRPSSGTCRGLGVDWGRLIGERFWQIWVSASLTASHRRYTGGVGARHRQIMITH
jgi:hypothetical protein